MKRIAFLTDLHLDEPFPFGNKVTPKENLEVVLVDLKRRGIQQVIFGGDIGEASAHPYFFKKLKRYSAQLILGNHDQYRDLPRFWKKGQGKGELYYDREDDVFKYLFLDSSSGCISSAQLAWLKGAIMTARKLIIFVHHPVLPIDTPADNLFALTSRELIIELLEKTEKEVTIFCRHYHMEDVCTYKNIKQIMTPSLSFQLVKEANDLEVDNSVFGYLLIEIEGGEIKTELISFRT